MSSKKEIITKYLEYINNKIAKSPRDYKLQIERSILEYELYKIQPKTYKLKPAIFSYRRAFTYKNNGQLDPLYKNSREEKEKRYIKILSQIDSKQIDSLFDEKAEIYENILPQLDPEKIEYILNPKIGNHLFKEHKDVELIIREIEKEIKKFQSNSIDIKTQEKITNKIENLLNRTEDMKNVERCISILEIIESVIRYHSLLIPEWYYLKGVFTLNVESIKNQIISWENICAIFNQGIDIKIQNQEKLENQIAEYSKSIIKLINCEQIDNLETKRKIGKKAIDTIIDKSNKIIREVEHEEKNKKTVDTIKRVKFLYIGDIYSSIEEHYLAIKNYLKASKIENKYSINREFADRMVKCLRFVDMNERKRILNDLSSRIDKNFYQGFYSYSYIFYQIGKGFFKQGIEELDKEAIKCFDEALKDYSGQYQVEIILGKIKVLRRLRKFPEADTLILRLLRIDQEKFNRHEIYGYLYEDNYRYALELYLKSNFEQQKYKRNSGNLRIKYSEFIHLINDLEKWSPSDNQLNEEYFIRRASIDYIKGIFIYEKKDFDFSEAENEQEQLERSFSLFKQAFNCFEDQLLIEKIKYAEYKDRTKYFLLQILENIIKIGYLLKKYEEIRPYLREGSEILNILIKDKKDKKNKNIKIYSQNNLIKTFELIDQFRVSGFDNKKESIEQAEIRKNISLNNLFSGSKKMTKFSFDDVIKILNIETAIVYWHIDLIEINCYLLVNEKNKAEVKYHHRIDSKNFIKFKKIYKEWSDSINKISKKPTPTNIKHEHPTLFNCVHKLGKILDLEVIIKTILREKNIKNIIIIPHRDLHGLPLHFLFNKFLDPAKRNYNLSFLPSIKIGLELDSNLVPDADMLIIHPCNESGKYLYHARTECTAINIKAHNTFLNQTRILEGDPDATWDEVEKMLRNCINYNYLHFLGHGSHDFENPKESNLKLTGTKHLTLELIEAKFDLSHFYLICLSACETGITTPISPIEEYVGLVSAILAQGVSYVVSTLWKVEDMSATLLMTKFYDELFTQKRHPIEALSEAQKWLRNSHKDALINWCKDQYHTLNKNLNNISTINSEDLKGKMETRLDHLESEAEYLQELSGNKPPYKSPYYWAGFTITGIPE